MSGLLQAGQPGAWPLTARRTVMRIFRFLTFCYLVLAIVLTSLSAIVPALAQDNSTTQIGAGSVWALVAPYLFTAVSAGVVAVLGWATALFKQWTGIQIEARHREALHSAAMTGVA